MQTTAQDSENGNQKARRSEKLSLKERRIIKRYAKNFNTIEEGAEELGIHRNTWGRLVGGAKTCNGALKAKIMDKLNAA
jgi:hypothetical protein